MRKQNFRTKAKQALEKTADVAETVEAVSGKVKHTSRNLAEKINAGHKATRTLSPRGTIIRDEASELPELAARIFVDPQDTAKQWFGKPIAIHPAGSTTTTIAYRNFDNLVYSAYSTAVIESVRYDLTGIFDLADFRTYINKLSAYLMNYYTLASQRAFMLDGDTICSRMNTRVSNNLTSKTEEALRTSQSILSTFVLPPNMVKFIYWLSMPYAFARTPNANIGQFITDDLKAAANDNQNAALLNDAYSTFTAKERTISGILGKLNPTWKMNVEKYVDMPTNVGLDFNWLNVWFNMGIQAPGQINPRDSRDYVLFNDNPNAICSALSTYYDGTQAQWEPNLVAPAITVGAEQTQFIDDVTGDYTTINITSDRMLGALRNMEYFNGTSYISTMSNPYAKSIIMTPENMQPDTTAIQQWLFQIDEVSSINRDLLKRR